MATRWATDSRLRRSLFRAAAVGVFETLTAVGIAFLNPFHIDEWAFERNQGVWQRIMADGYECHRSHIDWSNGRPCDWLGHPDWPAPNSAARRPQKGPQPPPITVLYLDEDSLAERGVDAHHKLVAADDAPTSHTLSLTEQQDLLDDVASARMERPPTPRPTAIFVDILFDDVAPDAASAAKVAPWLTLSDESGPEVLQKEIDAKKAACATPKPDGPAPDHFGCYVAHVASITHYSQWASAPCRRTSLTKLACIMRSGGIPVLFADDETLEDDENPVHDTLAMLILDKMAITVPAMIEGKGYPLVPDGNDGRPLDPSALAYKNYRLSPASLLYAAYCLAADAGGTPRPGARAGAGPGTHRDFGACPTLPTVPSEFAIGDHSNHLPKRNIKASQQADVASETSILSGWDHILSILQWSPKFSKRIDVLWGVGDDQPGLHAAGTFQYLIQRLHSPDLDTSNGRAPESDRCRSAAPEFLPRIGRVLREAAPIFAGPKDVKPCRYVPSLPATDLDNALTDKDKRLLLDRKVVMIGGHYQKSPDWIPALETAVPGVQYHAMALANLMDLNSGYRPVEQPVISGSSFVLASWRTFAAIFAISVGMGLATMSLNEPGLDPARVPANPRKPALAYKSLVLWLIRLLIVLAPSLLLAVAFLFFMPILHQFNLTVILALLAMATVKLAFVAIRPFFEEGNQFFRWFDISDGRLFGPDIDAPLKTTAKLKDAAPRRAPRRGHDKA